MVAARFVILFILLFSCCNALHADEPVARDIWKLQFTGNACYNADGIRTGLSLDRAMQVAAVDELPMDEYLDLLRRRIIRGYQSNGFRDVQVSMNLDQTAGVITANIVEGQFWKKGEVSVAGLSERECEYVASLMVQKSDHTNPLQEKQSKLKFWKTGSNMSFVDAVQDLYRPTVQEALTAIGYPQALFTIACPTVSEGEEDCVNLQITVTDPGIALTVGEIIFAGLEKHSREQLIEFLELKPGMPLTLPMREQIVSKLLDSGRFLIAEVTHEPFYFDPSEPLDLSIRVREYEGIALLGQEMTEVQQALMNLSKWLSRWEDGDDDLHVQFTGPTEQVNAVVQSIVPDEFQSFCNPALGTGAPGSFCVDAMTSPKDGTVFTFQIADPHGNVSMRRTLLLTKSTQGLIAWQSKKKWLHADRITLYSTIDLHGLWPNEDGNRCALKWNYGFNSGREGGLRSEFKSTPAAVMGSFENIEQSIAVNDSLRRLSLPHGNLELDVEKGTLRKLSAANEGLSLEITSGTGLVATELSRLEADTKEWVNQYQPGREWPALVSMVLEDVKAAELESSDALILCLDLLSNEAALKRLNTGLERLEDRRTLFIPQENVQHQREVAGLLRYMPMLVKSFPAGSFPHRLGLIAFESQSTGNSDLLTQFLRELLENDEQGAIYFELIARLTRNPAVAAPFAKAGLDRLSAAEFERDVAPFVSEPGVVHEVICSLLVWLRQTSDDDAEKIAKLAEIHLTSNDGKSVNVRPLLILIRSQQDKMPEEILPSLVPLVWEGGLRSWVEADLRSLAASTPTDTRKYFNASSTKIPNELTGKPGNLRSLGIAEAARTKILNELTKDAAKYDTKGRASVKPAGKSGSLEDIKLDDDWNLDD